MRLERATGERRRSAIIADDCPGVLGYLSLRHFKHRIKSFTSTYEKAEAAVPRQAATAKLEENFIFSSFLEVQKNRCKNYDESFDGCLPKETEELFERRGSRIDLMALLSESS